MCCQGSTLALKEPAGTPLSFDVLLYLGTLCRRFGTFTGLIFNSLFSLMKFFIQSHESSSTEGWIPVKDGFYSVGEIRPLLCFLALSHNYVVTLLRTKLWYLYTPKCHKVGEGLTLVNTSIIINYIILSNLNKNNWLWMLSPYLEIFHKNQKELFTQICQMHIEWGQTIAIVSLFSVATQRGSPIPSTLLTQCSSC